MPTPTNRLAWTDVLARLEHRRNLLQEKCIEALTRESDLTQQTAQALVERWDGLIQASQTAEGAWLEQATGFGRWCAAQDIPFATIMALLYYYKQAVLPLILREYPGVEGYLEGHLALDELLTRLMGHIPEGYYRP